MTNHTLSQAAGEIPRIGYGWISEEKKCQEICRRVTSGERDGWIMKEAVRFQITVPQTRGH